MEILILNCIQCEEDFEFSIEEQEKYNQKGFDAPLRCPPCRRNKAKSPNLEGKKKVRDKKKHYRPKPEEYFDS